MRGRYLLILVWAFAALTAEGQIRRTKKKEDALETPRSIIGAKLSKVRRAPLSDDEYNAYMTGFSRETMGQDEEIRKFFDQAEQWRFWSRRSVWASATMPARSKLGARAFAKESSQRPTMEDRYAATELPETNYATKGEDAAILAAAYRHFFDYRAQGVGNLSRLENARLRVENAGLKDVYFLGLGPHIDDAPPSLLAALQNDPELLRDKVSLRPLSKVLEVTAEAIRDRDTGAFGPAFRVDAIGPEENGEVKVMATFTEREGFWFTREFTLQRGKAGWEVVKDAEYALQ